MPFTQEIIRHLKIYPLPVGQGLSIKINPFGHLLNCTTKLTNNLYSSEILYDFGGPKRNILRVLPLISKNVNLLILSHFDADHISGVPFLLENKKIDYLWIPGVGDEFRLCQAISSIFQSGQMKYDDEDLIRIAHFAVNYKDYIHEYSPGIKTREVRTVLFDDLESDDISEYQRDIIFEEPENIHQLFSIDFNSPENDQVLLRVNNHPCFIFKVLFNGNKDIHHNPELGEYVEEIETLLDIKLSEINDDPITIAQKIVQCKKEKKFKEIAKKITIKINDTSMIIAGKLSNFQGTNSWDSYSTNPVVKYIKSEIGFHSGWIKTDMFFNNPVAWRYLHSQPYHHYPQSLDFSKWSLLLTGDVNKNPLEKLKNIYSLIFQVPHHGSKNSLSDTFYHNNTFNLSICSFGDKNRNNHPHQDVIDTLNKFRIQTLFSTEYSSWILTHMRIDKI